MLRYITVRRPRSYGTHITHETPRQNPNEFDAKEISTEKISCMHWIEWARVDFAPQYIASYSLHAAQHSIICGRSIVLIFTRDTVTCAPPRTHNVDRAHTRTNAMSTKETLEDVTERWTLINEYPHSPHPHTALTFTFLRFPNYFPLFFWLLFLRKVLLSSIFCAIFLFKRWWFAIHIQFIKYYLGGTIWISHASPFKILMGSISSCAKITCVGLKWKVEKLLANKQSHLYELRR